MFFKKLFAKKEKYPENAKYQKGDFVNFRREFSNNADEDYEGDTVADTVFCNSFTNPHYKCCAGR